MTISDEIVEAAARTIFKNTYPSFEYEADVYERLWAQMRDHCRDQAESALAATLPLIRASVRAETLEEAAKTAEHVGDSHEHAVYETDDLAVQKHHDAASEGAYAAAAFIRSLKEKTNDRA